RLHVAALRRDRGACRGRSGCRHDAAAGRVARPDARAPELRSELPAALADEVAAGRRIGRVRSMNTPRASAPGAGAHITGAPWPGGGAFGEPRPKHDRTL